MPWAGTETLELGLGFGVNCHAHALAQSQALPRQSKPDVVPKQTNRQTDRHASPRKQLLMGSTCPMLPPSGLYVAPPLPTDRLFIALGKASFPPVSCSWQLSNYFLSGVPPGPPQITALCLLIHTQLPTEVRYPTPDRNDLLRSIMSLGVSEPTFSSAVSTTPCRVLCHSATYCAPAHPPMNQAWHPSREATGKQLVMQQGGREQVLEKGRTVSQTAALRSSSLLCNYESNCYLLD